MVAYNYITVFFVLILLITTSVNAEKKKKSGKGKRGKNNNPIRVAMEAWVASFVPEVDYNQSHWRYHFHSVSQSVYFDHYVRKLSDIFKSNSAQVNFVMVGACDGVTDPLIKFRFLKYDHWRGVFVEPMSINVRDLAKFLEENGASNRSHIIRAAATDKCTKSTIDVERPLYEEKAISQNKSVPHWLRRQIGSILPISRSKARSSDWIVETVACKTATDILKDWAEAVPNIRPDGKVSKISKRRPHVLKIDVEGHDYQVLTGFINDNTPVGELPLLVEFEAKSIAEKYDEAKAILERRGYVVSEFGQDGFALLRADRTFPERKKKSDASETEE